MNKNLYHTRVGPWLKANLGPRCLAPLTGTDARALIAAVQIVELWSEGRSASAAQSFRLVVLEMQQHTRGLAYHAIAHVMDWSHRQELWIAAGLPEVTHTFGRCVNEPT